MALPQPKPRPDESVWRCESCGEAVEPEDCIVETHEGYAGEAWGTCFRQRPVEVVVSPCCRSFVVNQWDNYLPADLVRPEVW
jgi:hypothetical protein